MSEEAAALAVVDGAYMVWRECVRSIPTCDTSNFDQYLADPQLSGDREDIAEWQNLSYEMDNVDSIEYEVIEAVLDHAIPHVVVCESSGSVLVERLPGQPDRVVEGEYVESVREVQLTRTADGWRVEGFATRERVDDQVGALCS